MTLTTNWVNGEEYFQKDSVALGKNLKLEATPQGLNPVSALPPQNWPEHIASSFWALLYQVVNWWWSHFLSGVVLKVGWDTLTQARRMLLDTHRCSAHCHHYLVHQHFDVWIWVSKRGRNLARDAEVAVAEAVTLSLSSDLFKWAIQTALSRKREGGRLCCLNPIILWNVPNRNALLWVMSWKQIHRFDLCLGFCDLNRRPHFPPPSPFSDKVLVGIGIFHSGPEKPREVNRRRLLPWRDQYPQLWTRSNKMMLGYSHSHSFSFSCFRWINDFYPKKWPKWFIVVLLLWREPQIKHNLKAKCKTFFCVVGSGCFETWCLGKAGHLWH